jgi:hypothetical protein
VNAKQEIYQILGKRLKECNASEDFFESVRAMLMKRENLNPKALRDPNLRERNSAAADVISWQRRTLLEPLKQFGRSRLSSDDATNQTQSNRLLTSLAVRVRLCRVYKQPLPLPSNYVATRLLTVSLHRAASRLVTEC